MQAPSTTLTRIITEQQHEAFLKLGCLLSFSGSATEKYTSNDFIVNDLAIVRLYIEDSGPGPLECQMLTQAKSGKVKVKVSCQDMDEPFYSEWICGNSWKLIGKKDCCDISLGEVYSCFFNINISASKVEDSFLIKLYNDDYFTDFNLCAADGSVAVHRAHLAAHSDVFHAMLTHEWKETMEGRVQSEGVSLQTLKHFKGFMYLQILPDEGLRPLLLFASYYFIGDLKTECISKLALNCRSDDWRGLLEFATRNQIFELVSAIMIVSPTITVQDEETEDQNEDNKGDELDEY